jgi:hypothetical protein
MTFNSMTLCMNVHRKVYILLEQVAALEALLKECISQRISLRHKGQFPGGTAKCNTGFLTPRTFISWK